MNQSTKKTKKELFDFEKGMARLEEIVTLFDEGGLTLSEMEAYFEEGMDLVAKCSDRLEKTETKVTQLMENAQEKLQEEPFEEEG